MVFGTPEFMSPEQACGQSLDGRSDLYSLAATMFAMLTGCGMYQAGSPIEWLTAHARQPPPHLADGNPALAAYGSLDAMLQRCLAKHREGRPADADAMIGEIEQVERELGVATAEPPPAVGLPEPSTVPGRRLASTFSPSSFIAALAPELAQAPRSSAPTIDTPLDPTDLPDDTPARAPWPATAETGALEVPGRRGLWLALGGLAITGVIVAAVVVAAGARPHRASPAARPVDAAEFAAGSAAGSAAVPPPADAMVVDAVPLDAVAIDAVPVARPTHTGPAIRPERPAPPSHTEPHAAEIDEHLAKALAAQQHGKRMTQVIQAHAAYLLGPEERSSRAAARRRAARRGRSRARLQVLT